MKKLIIGVLSTALLITGSTGICDAYSKHYGNNVKNEKIYFKSARRMRDDARYVIHRTAEVIYAAQRSVKSHHRHRKNWRNRSLALAVAHQREARELYMDGFYRDAIHHSLRARDLAFQVLEANREKPRREFYRDSREDEYGRNAPKDKDLDLKIDIRKVGDDYEVTRFELDLDID